MHLAGQLIEEVRGGLDAARTIAATLLSARHHRLDRSAIGMSVERPVEAITPELAVAYAAATGDPTRYVLGDVAPPFLASRLVLPLLKEVVFGPRLKINLLRMVHAEQELAWRRPLRVGEGGLRMRLTATEIEETRAGELLRLRGEVRRGGEAVGEANVGLLIRKAPSHRKPGDRVERTGDGRERFRLTLATDRDQALRYAAASGDTNLIHTSRLVARVAGLPRPILHGMCVMAMVTGALVREWAGGDPTACAKVSVRFSRPVFPGDALTVVGFEGEDPEQLPFEVWGPGKKPVLRRGLLRRRDGS